ncbi:hypothetical protein [Nocardia sp. NBC_01009]|uniref:hypothetical protein n=1 Tax=Nocardia sp. NBC_01009 TaxID=2975996 RepID=UPI00386CB750|nr:hypothetical protein OHA42_04885 [Nocardia sp. NBC_01009]
MSGGFADHWEDAEDEFDYRVIEPIDHSLTLAIAAQGAADEAVSAAEAAANEAANAAEKADIAYAASVEWSLEFVVASAEVLLGVNELLLGPVLNVRDGRTAILTDIHIALVEQLDGVTIETRIWDVTNTTYRTAHTGTLDPVVNRRSYSALTVDVDDKERFWVYVTDIDGDTPPTVLQVCVAGVYLDEP